MTDKTPYETLSRLPDIDRFIIDASSIIKACCYAGKDEEFGVTVDIGGGKTQYVNSGYYGSELFLASLSSTIELYGFKPYQIVLALDGYDGNRLRKNMFSGYKAQRKTLIPELAESFNVAISRSAKLLKNLGAIVVQQELTEADDIIAYLCQTLRGRKLIWSRDGDMLALQNEQVDVLLNDTLNPDLSIACDNKYVGVYKALVGDSSDNLPGAKGFGAKAFEAMVLKYGDEGLDELQYMLESKTLDVLDPDDFKPFQNVLDSLELVYKSYDCAKFYPQYVNTAYTPMEITSNLTSPPNQDTHPYLERFAGTVTLTQTNAEVESLKAHLRMSPYVALDLETTVPIESDEWAAAIQATKKTKTSPIVDVFGSIITGVGITCGANLSVTYYTPFKHLDCVNFTMDDLADIIDAIPAGVPVAVHNSNFELPVIYNNVGGWVSCVVDTQIMKSYVDENTQLGLKKCSKQYFDYDQASYEDTTQGRKMDELTGAEVLSYGADDTIVTAALYNLFKFIMELEGTLDAFEKCELATQYWVSGAFVDGFTPDLERLEELSLNDQREFAISEIALNEYLTRIGWDGCEFKPLPDLSPASVKRAFLELSGEKLDCRARLPEKVAAAVRDQGQPELAELVETGDLNGVNNTLEAVFEGSPEFSVEKDAHLKALVYDTWGLPIRFRTIPTDIMRSKGITEGNPQIDVPAIDHALALDLIGEDEETEEKRNILMLIRKMKACNTRNGLYYTPYPVLTHWKDGKIHPQLGQSRAVTRRFTPSAPNINQLPKKGEGLAVRDVVKAPEGWLVFASDFNGQELRLAADASQDEAMLSCYIGENLRDPHSITGAAIAAAQGSEFGDYDTFVANLEDKAVKKFRGLGKGVNFSSQYLCRAPKLAKLLVTDVDSAQTYLDAKDKTYAGLHKWQYATIDLAKETGYAFTRLGAKRHLAKDIKARDKYTAAEAERRAVNFAIQGSAAEMTKLAINEMASRGLLNRGDAHIVFPVHDEVVLFIRIAAIHETLPAIHECMTIPYADMQVPLESDISIGRSFGSMVEVGSKYDKKKVQAVIDEIQLTSINPKLDEEK